MKPHAPDTAPPWLVADIGGTNARFGWVDAAGSVQHVRTLPVSAHAGPAEAAQAYLNELPQSCRVLPPRHAAFAVATPVEEGAEVEMTFTNSPWRFSRRGLQQALALESLLVLNDFEALAWSLPRLHPAQLRAHGPLPGTHGTLAVVGPGTGLGVAGLLHTPQGWHSMPSEGGHAMLAAADDQEAALLAQVRRLQGAPVSAETLLSGTGLPLLHRALLELHGGMPQSWSAADITTHAVEGTDADCMRTVQVFCELLGSFAGDVALTLGARGGVYLGGGIVPRLGDVFFASRFRERFEAKGAYRPYLAAIPTAVVLDTLAALDGAAAALQRRWSGPA